MRIEVLDVIDGADGQVRFAYKGREAVGWWRARRAATPGWHHVELDVPDPLTWGVDLVVAPPAEPTTTLAVAADGVVVLRGELLQLDEAGVGVVGLGDTSVTIETAGRPPAGAVGQQVLLTVARLELFPYDL